MTGGASSGTVIAIGRTSTVVEFGAGRVAKVLAPDVPDHWADAEAVFTDEVRRAGAPAPEVVDVVVVDGRPAIVFERITGPSMWQAMLADTGRSTELVDLLVSVQADIHRLGPCARIPALVDRMDRKITEVDSLSLDDRTSASAMLAACPAGAALLHGDLHPGNILLSPAGPVVIDWFDACIGAPAADIARTALLLQPREATDLRHLPGAGPELIEVVFERYGSTVDVPGRRADWTRLVAISRLAERTDADPSGLVATWRADRPAAL